MFIVLRVTTMNSEEWDGPSWQTGDWHRWLSHTWAKAGYQSKLTTGNWKYFVGDREDDSKYDVVTNDLREVKLSWKDASAVAAERDSHGKVQCFMHVGWIVVRVDMHATFQASLYHSLSSLLLLPAGLWHFLNVVSRGDGMSTLQNGVAAYSQSPISVFARVVSHCPLCSFHLPECRHMVGPLLTFRQPLSLPLPVEQATQHWGQV